MQTSQNLAAQARVAVQISVAAQPAAPAPQERAQAISSDAGPLARYQRRVDLLLADKAGQDNVRDPSLSSEQHRQATAAGTEAADHWLEPPLPEAEVATAPMRSVRPQVAPPVWLKSGGSVTSVPVAETSPAAAGAPASAVSAHAVSQYAADWASRLVRLAGRTGSLSWVGAKSYR